MIETLILVACIYGLMKSDNLVKVAAFTSFLAYPAIFMFAKAGAQNLVLLLLAIEAVPFAFGLLLVHIFGNVFLLGALVSILSERLSILFTTLLPVVLFWVWYLPLNSVVIIVGIMSLAFSFVYLRKHPRRKLFYSLMYLFTFSMLMFISAT